MDALPVALSSTVLPIYLTDKVDAMEHVVREGMAKAFITYEEPKNNRIFVPFSSPTWFQKKTFMDNFRRTINEVRKEIRFDPNAVQWEKISQAFLRNPDRALKNADKRMIYLQQYVHCQVLFHLWTEKGGAGHDPPDSDDQCSRAHLRVAAFQSQESGGTELVSEEL
ncbi:hypothetical protein NPIL_640191 [Nephila pilipes]|uniref:Uncharacterized protein n=1 Tax=Nephila pilipes TaxID=299642 RepID=A0A8X6NV71_NEPPI|nr:hypothetical protein NPIL_640191 [Nephila pilipes]